MQDEKTNLLFIFATNSGHAWRKYDHILTFIHVLCLVCFVGAVGVLQIYGRVWLGKHLSYMVILFILCIVND